MGHTNSTANLSLPQFIGTDKPTWLGDVNGAFGAIDTAVGTINADILAVDAKADNAVADASSAVTVANNASTTAGNASTTATTANNIANNALTVANNADGHTNQLELKVGLLADLTTTDKTSIVNAINEVNGAIGTPSASQVSYDNTGSGLTAINVQDAIDELALGGSGTYTSTDLWVNPDPSQSFSSSDVTLSSSNYKMLMFVYKKYATGGSTEASQIIPKGYNVSLFMVLPHSSGVRAMERTATYVNDTKYTLSDASLATGNTSASTDNTCVIPLKIIGIDY